MAVNLLLIAVLIGPPTSVLLRECRAGGAGGGGCRAVPRDSGLARPPSVEHGARLRVVRPIAYRRASRRDTRSTLAAPNTRHRMRGAVTSDESKCHSRSRGPSRFDFRRQPEHIPDKTPAGFALRNIEERGCIAARGFGTIRGKTTGSVSIDWLALKACGAFLISAQSRASFFEWCDIGEPFTTNNWVSLSSPRFSSSSSPLDRRSSREDLDPPPVPRGKLNRSVSARGDR